MFVCQSIVCIPRNIEQGMVVDLQSIKQCGIVTTNVYVQSHSLSKRQTSIDLRNDIVKTLKNAFSSSRRNQNERHLLGFSF